VVMTNAVTIPIATAGTTIVPSTFSSSRVTTSERKQLPRFFQMEVA
jgi:hypothetical protein